MEKKQAVYTYFMCWEFIPEEEAYVSGERV